VAPAQSLRPLDLLSAFGRSAHLHLLPLELLIWCVGVALSRPILGYIYFLYIFIYTRPQGVLLIYLAGFSRSYACSRNRSVWQEQTSWRNCSIILLQRILRDRLCSCSAPGKAGEEWQAKQLPTTIGSSSSATLKEGKTVTTFLPQQNKRILIIYLSNQFTI